MSKDIKVKHNKQNYDLKHTITADPKGSKGSRHHGQFY